MKLLIRKATENNLYNLNQIPQKINHCQTFQNYNNNYPSF